MRGKYNNTQSSLFSLRLSFCLFFAWQAVAMSQAGPGCSSAQALLDPCSALLNPAHLLPQLVDPAPLIQVREQVHVHHSDSRLAN